MKVDSISNVRSYLIDQGIVYEKNEPLIKQLGGGVCTTEWQIC